MVEVDLNNGTIYHDVTRKSGSSVVYMRPASPGTGVIAGGAMRAIFEAAGVEDILAKCVTTSNAINVVRATMDALTSCASPKKIAERRGKKLSDIIDSDK